MQDSVPEPNQDWQNQNDANMKPLDSNYDDSNVQEPTEIVWRASEFISREKTTLWFAGLAAGAIVLAAAVFFLSGGGYFSSATIGVVALLFGIVSVKKPRELEYRIDNSGIAIGAKKYSYESFKAFALTQEGAMPTIVLLPLGRFMPPISVYCTAEDMPAILAKLEEFLPEDTHRYDAIDRFLRRIRF